MSVFCFLSLICQIAIVKSAFLSAVFFFPLVANGWCIRSANYFHLKITQSHSNRTRCIANTQCYVHGHFSLPDFSVCLALKCFGSRVLLFPLSLFPGSVFVRLPGVKMFWQPCDAFSSFLFPCSIYAPLFGVKMFWQPCDVRFLNLS